jgi:hypothetical protein
MTGKIFNITPEQMQELVPFELDQITLGAAQASRPLIAGFYGDDLVCVAGLVPISIISDTAYLWMCTTDTVHKHKLVFARHVRREMKRFSQLYPRIIGHCITPSSRLWLESLGATFAADGISWEIVND